jgi:hypothetical protein
MSGPARRAWRATLADWPLLCDRRRTASQPRWPPHPLPLANGNCGKVKRLQTCRSSAPQTRPGRDLRAGLANEALLGSSTSPAGAFKAGGVPYPIRIAERLPTSLRRAKPRSARLSSFGYVRGTTFHEVEAVRPWESMSNCMIVSRIWLCAQEAAQMLDF